MRKVMWIIVTCLIYACLAVGFWLMDSDMHSNAWYFVAAAPVFLFSAAFYFLIKRMRRDYYESGAMEKE